MQHESNKIFGANLKRIRLGAGLTQDQIAEAMGIPQPRYQRHESGTTEASLEFILGAARALKVHPAELLVGQATEAPTGPAEGGKSFLSSLASELRREGLRMTLEPVEPFQGEPIRPET